MGGTGVTSGADDSDVTARATFVPLPPARLARAVVAAVFIGLTAVGFLRIVYEQGQNLASVGLSFCCIVVLLMLQLLWFSGPQDRLRTPFGYGLLAVQAGLVYLPMIRFNDAWAAMPGFLAGSTLLVLPAFFAWGAFAAVVASMGVLQGVFTGSIVDIAYSAISTLVTGFVVYGLSRLASLVVELHAARAEMAQMAVVRERLRFARDLHDLLGYSLSAIKLKIELTHRLLETSPAGGGRPAGGDPGDLAARAVGRADRRERLPRDVPRRGVPVRRLGAGGRGRRGAAGLRPHRPARAREHRAGDSAA